jgi:hypothetical protein
MPARRRRINAVLCKRQISLTIPCRWSSQQKRKPLAWKRVGRQGTALRRTIAQSKEHGYCEWPELTDDAAQEKI